MTDFSSPLDGVFFAKRDESVAVRRPVTSGICKSNFVAASTNAATNRRNDISGLFGGVCRHGAMDICLGKIVFEQLSILHLTIIEGYGIDIAF